MDGFDDYDSDSDVFRHLNFSDPQSLPFNLSLPPSTSSPPREQGSASYGHVDNAIPNLISRELDMFRLDPSPLPPREQGSTSYAHVGNALPNLIPRELNIFRSDPPPPLPRELGSASYQHVGDVLPNLIRREVNTLPSDPPPPPPYLLPIPTFHGQRSTDYNQVDSASQHLVSSELGIIPFHQPTSLTRNDEADDRNDTDGDVQRHLLCETEPLSFGTQPAQPPPHHEDLLVEEPLVQHVDRDVSRDPDFLRSMIFALSGFDAENDGSGASSSNPPADRIDQPTFVPFVPSELDCTNCMPLREVIYTNGSESVKFIIHGRLGTFSHFIFYMQNTMEGTEPNYRQFMMDVSTQNHQWVKNFISLYQTQMINDGFAVFTDKTASFVEALYGGVSTSSDAAAVGPSQVPEHSSGESSSISRGSTIGSDYEDELTTETTSSEFSTLPVVASSSVGTSRQSIERSHPTTSGNASNRTRHMSIQRARVKNMTIDDVREYFHLPITAAAQMLNVCTSAIKTVCRRNGMLRWPQRQIAGIDKKIGKLRERLRTGKFPQRAEKIEEEIASLLQKKARIYAGESGAQ